MAKTLADYGISSSSLTPGAYAGYGYNQGKSVGTPPPSAIAPISTPTTNPSTNSMSMFTGSLSDAGGFMSDPFGMGTTNAQTYLDSLGPSGIQTTEQAYNYSLLQQGDTASQGPSVMDIGSTLLNAYNVFNNIKMQNEYMDMAKEQLGMAKEQWSMTKDEVTRIARVRNNLNAGYQSGNYGASPQSKTYA